LVTAAVAAWPGSAAHAASKAQVSLLPSVEAVVPGQPFDVAIRFQLESGWHIYWQNSGDSGLPPSVRWTLPEGFAVGELQFPTPKRHVSPGDIITNILRGEPVLVVKVTPPAVIKEGSVKLGAAVGYLVCEKACLREDTTLSLDLPVQSAGAAKPANAEVFERAKRAMPKATSKYVTVTPSVKPDPLSPGTKFDLLMTVDVASGHHVQSNKPSAPSLIPSDVFVERQEGVRFDRPVFPEGKIRPDKYLGKLSEYDGRITVRIPGEVDSSRSAGPIRIAGIFTYQACDEEGHCFPPDAVSFTLTSGSASATSVDTARPASSAAASSPSTPVAGSLGDKSGIEGILGRFGLVGLLIGCFLYGLFINATPCVLPLLSIKVLGFVHQAHESRRRTLGLGLSFGTGVMLFFVLLGLLAAGLLTEGRYNILQIPAAVIGLGAVVMGMGLSMLGVFTLQPPTAAVNLEAHITQEGMAASFGKGALAPVLGFACTGPLLAGAFGWATQQPRATAIAAFLFMGLGMASPYMLLSARPNWLGFLPKPGPWMITFERIMGFLLLAMVIWLLHPLIVQIGAEGLEWTLVFLIFVGFACWVLGQVRYDMSVARRWVLRGSAVGVVVLVGGVIYEGIFPLNEAVAAAKAEREAKAACANGESPIEVAGLVWRPWSRAAVEETVRAGKLVFVDFTAAYCTQCRINKIVAINTSEFVERIKALGAVTFQGDLSIRDKAVENELQRHGRGGVPLNLIYPPGKPDAPIVLDTELTKAYLLGKLDEASISRSASSATIGS
jgi:thiol:disulfide interchange protein DsbD